MAYRFVAFIWDHLDQESEKYARELATSFAASGDGWERMALEGVTIFHLAPRTQSLRSYALPNSSGLVVGRLFKNGGQDGASAIPDFDAATANQIVATRGRALVESYWGSYVAIIKDRENRRVFVIRDCSGKIPCWILRVRNVTLAFSNLEDVLGLKLAPLTINWRYIAGFLYFDDLRNQESGVNEISEVLAGGCVSIGIEGTRDSFVWDPTAVCRAGSLADPEECIRALRVTTQTCVSAWASVYQRLLHNLSGGFDSAVVLGCLSHAPKQPRVTCLNRFSPHPEEDERTFAREAAALASAELLEVDWTAGGYDMEGALQCMPRLAKPTVLMLASIDTRFRNTLACKYGAEATWTGQGGDHLFFEVSTLLGASDYIRDHAFGPRFFSVIADAARMTNEPYWTVLREALRGGFWQKKWKPTNDTWGQKPFVNREALPDAVSDYICHPWLRTLHDIPLGKQFHIRTLADLLNQPAPLIFEEEAPEHHPLISQPLIELSLRIPIYDLVKGGRGRALAREAFSGVIPESIRSRHTKGSTRTYTSDLIRENREFVREFLLDGLLVHERLLSIAELERCLSGGAPLRPTQIFPLVACISAEAWVRSWHGDVCQRKVA